MVKLAFKMYSGGLTSTIYGSVITDGQWHYVTATRNGTTGESKLYVDGILTRNPTQFFL